MDHEDAGIAAGRGYPIDVEPLSAGQCEPLAGGHPISARLHVVGREERGFVNPLERQARTLLNFLDCFT